MSGSLKEKTVGALSWSLVQEIAQRGMQFVIGIFLARLLGPVEFGLVAMLTIFITIGGALAESGFGSAIIQRKELTAADTSSAFFGNVLFSLCLTVTLWIAAPLIARFYDQSALTSLTRAWSVVLVINSFGVVQSALMVRDLNFKGQAVVTVLSTGISGVVGLTLAWRGWGAWSLVWQQITFAFVRACVLWLSNRWRPSFLLSRSSFSNLFAFGSRMVAASVVDTLFENLYSVVIGKIYSPLTLGFYNRAYTLQDTVSRLLSAIANRVTFPVFSQLQEDSDRLRRGLRKATTTLVFAQFPMMVGLAAIARPLVIVLLGEKWEPCVSSLQILCFAGLFYPMHLLNLNVLMAKGRSDLYFRVVLIRRTLVVLNILLTFDWGILPMVWGQAVISVVSLFVNAYYTRELAGYSLPAQIRDVAPYLIASIAMGGVVVAVALPDSFSVASICAIKICSGALVYLAICSGFRLTALSEIASILRRKSPVPA